MLSTFPVTTKRSSCKPYRDILAKCEYEYFSFVNLVLCVCICRSNDMHFYSNPFSFIFHPPYNKYIDIEHLKRTSLIMQIQSYYANNAYCCKYFISKWNHRCTLGWNILHCQGGALIQSKGVHLCRDIYDIMIILAYKTHMPAIYVAGSCYIKPPWTKMDGISSIMDMNVGYSTDGDVWKHIISNIFANDIFECIFVNENAWISIQMSHKFVPKGQINNTPALVQIMAWCLQGGDKPLSEPMMVRLLTRMCVTRS